MINVCRPVLLAFVGMVLSACTDKATEQVAAPANLEQAAAAPSVRLLRNATVVVEIGGKKMLVDPMLAAKAAYDPFPGAGNDRRNPMVDLPLTESELDELLASVDAVLITHTHLDHWDVAAQQGLRKDVPLFVQPADAETIAGQGFTNVTPVDGRITWQGLTIDRTDGQHGLGELGQRLGPVSGFVLADGQTSIYLAGDTRWVEEVRQALDAHRPTVAVLNAGGAEFIEGPLAGGAITMTAEDVIAAHRHAPGTRFIAVHMDALNHCAVTRDVLRSGLEHAGLLEQIVIPNDGETIRLQDVSSE